ncbi:MAG: bifunctional diaminohydroxyphosphoribosylaminopyrimidine deaminase/5-amino-6-(5-phosphoribosylamino)uracil reductase RibD [Hyphomicrobiales bacterium]|nr:bifunctional diaminohydroxyphosphoribosylaminopyrimidine deaminase/5-amino-6-(5-phosphoribosylamino)uracil reductase RibD [Hyphomicrobiales bacterium]
MASQDETFMGVAVAMARRGLGQVWPNPAVGAVLVSNDTTRQVVARGWTMPGGRPHAEAEALRRAGERAKNATLYVTLEPCAHQGVTPPCVDSIIAAGVTRVVCGVQDPDSRVCGRGVEKLRAAGIEVELGVLEDRALEVTLGHVLRVTHNRPQICLKLAIGSDGLVAPGDGAPIWVTDELARARGHLMRARADAILVGRGTIAADNPALSCRLPGMEHRSPVRVVLDSNLLIPRDARVMGTASDIPTWICCSSDASDERRSAIRAAGAETIEIKRRQDGLLDPASVAAALAERGITRLLIEGGPSVAGSFLEAGIINDVVIFQGQMAAGDTGLQPFGTAGAEQLANSDTFQRVERRSIGRDSMTRYKTKISQKQ